MRIYHRECLSLAEAGYRVALAAHALPGEALNPTVEFFSLGEYDTPSLSWRLRERYLRCKRAFDWARLSCAALFHYCSPEFIPWAARLKRITRCPVIFDCMEDFEGYAKQRRRIPAALRKPLALCVDRFLRHAARTCDAIITADYGTAELLRPYARRVVVLHNFPSLALFPDPGEGAGGEEYDLVYHGSIPRYHLDVCLAVDAVLRDKGHRLKWRLIGRIAETDWLESELHRRGIRERFSVGGQVPHNQVAHEVRKAKIGIVPLPDLPKFRNNIPQKIFEFMALRMPFVTSDLPPSRPFVGDGKCAVMVPPQDYGAYADAIIRLLGDRSLRERMGAEGRRRVEAEYNWELESHKLLDLYAELLSVS
jgi:glycosyltransferase involved in cell wall biosynthesis